MSNPNLREAVVAGKFYPASAEAIKKQLHSFTGDSKTKQNALACLMPHAGYVYSGEVASLTASQVIIKDKVILLGPNHTGYGQPFSVSSHQAWQTPLGRVNIDQKLAKKLTDNSAFFKLDSLAHAYEHSLEVELPILQLLRDDFEILPIAFSSENLDLLKKAGHEIAEAVISSGIKDKTLIVASSDMTHYQPQKEAEEKDRRAIEAVLKLDEDLLFENIRKYDISMCGYAPVAVMLSCVKKLGAKKGELVKYQTSAEVTKDRASVVGYAGIIIT
jgi:MEMO1 family protein